MQNAEKMKRSKASKDDWETPLAFFHYVQRKFGVFTLDPCTSEKNPLGTPKFFTEKENGLVQSWEGEHVFCNPPYNQVKLWMDKALEEATLNRASTVMLVPARPDTQHWWDYARFADVYFIKGRIRFVNAESGALFPSALLHFRKESGLWLGKTEYLNVPVRMRR